MTHPRRKWGQHWLASDQLANALVALVAPAQGDHFVEIGPGRGRLTEALLRHPVRVTALEIDAVCCEALEALGYGDRLEIINLDILTADFAFPWPEGRPRLIGNLPYNVSSPILRWTARRRSDLVDAHYMLQEEVAERIVAGPGSRTYGLLSVLLQWEFSVQVLKRLSAGAFRPPPRVASAFVGLTPLSEDRAHMPSSHQLAVLGAAFAHRRKKLTGALALGGWPREVVASACATAGIDAEARAERLSPGDYISLAAALPEPPG